MVAKVKEIDGTRLGSISKDILDSQSPIVFKGLISHWPLVQRAKESNEQAIEYLKHFCIEKPVVVYSTPPELKGKFFYTEDGTDLNFNSTKAPLSYVLQELARLQDVEQPPSVYVGSTTVDVYLPGLSAENNILIESPAPPLVSLWVGNGTTVAAHFDAPANLACCAAGRRTFTVFPPDQVANLYVGPLDKTPSGQAISMVDFDNPDFSKFPKFKEALERAFVAELEAGDALFLPGMWWHQVKASSSFNVLINYWMRDVPRFMGPGIEALKHAILNIRDLPPSEKKAWRELFEFYVFSDQENKFDHIPPPARGCLAPLNEDNARQIRAWLLNRLNR
ncbi:cupin-like domain-containing protein [Saccharophagus sp. K07]|jgi:hypothetical protein|uniref:cupin-like domain-containing protein n=1 Tax=Saccharophagus sp. K07 TaxID=2283636 RepID=UPI0016526DCD|nr:cupin-like domain-containing protein [Saccharophagus sp. K07]MBC6906363.1 cupin-like domain-containing protein [Saccharophagus sp. K07]